MHFERLIWKSLLPAAAFFAGVVLLSGGVAATNSVSISPAAIATGTTPLATDTTKLQTQVWVETENGRQYIQADGSYAMGVQTIDGMVYFFDEDGYQETRWQTLDGVRHYYDPKTGEAYVGEKLLGETWFLFDNNGQQKVGWRTVHGLRQYYDPETGYVQHGWVEAIGYRYYSEKTTGKQTGEITVDSVQYLMDETYGYQTLGLCEFKDGTLSYFQEDGVLYVGWLTVSDEGLYFGNETSAAQSGDTYYFGNDGSVSEGWKSLENGRYYFGDDGKMCIGARVIDGVTYTFSSDGRLRDTTGYGIDVSRWQGDIDWDTVAASGKVDFAILRAGYGKYMSGKDTQFERNYAACKRLGIPVGVYWYSYATTPAQAVQEAKTCLSIIKDKTFEYPITFDIEERSGLRNADAITKAFCDTLIDAGYYVAIYSYKSALEDYFSAATLDAYDVWVAHVNVRQTDYAGDYTLWQYSFKGSIPGINGNVDLDRCYVDYPGIIISEHKNGY